MKLQPLTLKNKLLIFLCLFFYLLGFVFGGWSIVFHFILLSFIFTLIKKSFDKGILLNSYLVIILIFLILNNLIKIGYFLNLVNNYQLKKEGKKLVSNKNLIKTFYLGNFKVDLIDSEIVTPKQYVDFKKYQYDKQSEDYKKAYPYQPPTQEEINSFQQVQKSSLNEEKCELTNNAYWFNIFSSKRLEMFKKIDMPQYSLTLISWNQKELNFKDKKIEEKVNSIINNIENLSKYENQEYLEKNLLSKMSSGFISSLNLNNELGFVNLNNFIPGNCSPVGKIPVYIKRIPDKRFDFVYFARASSEGQQSIISEPYIKILLIKKGDDFLFIEDIQENIDIFKLENDSCSLKSDSEAIKCRIKQYYQKHFDKKDEELWITKMLSTISINSNQVLKLPSPSPDWKRYIDDKGDYYLDLPNYFFWNKQVENIVLFEKNLTQKPHRTNNYIQITKGGSFKNTEEKINKLKKMSVGEKKVIQIDSINNEEMNQFFTYERLPDQYINGYKAMVFVNRKPFEAGEENNYYIFLIDDYTIEAITNENSDSLDNISYNEFYKIVSSFRIIKLNNNSTSTINQNVSKCRVIENKIQEDIDYENAEKNLSSYSYKEYLPGNNPNEKPLEKITNVSILEKKLLPCERYDDNYCQLSNKNLWTIKYPKKWQLFRIKREKKEGYSNLEYQNSSIFYDLKFEYQDSYFYLREIKTLGGQPIIIENNQWKNYLQLYCDKPFFTDKNKTNFYLCKGDVINCASYINDKYNTKSIKKHLKSFIAENSSIQKGDTLIYDFYFPSINFGREKNPAILAYVLSSDFYSNDEEFISELKKIYISLVPISK